MIFSRRHYRKDWMIECDICVIGSGAGGSAAAWAAAHKNRNVVVIESGPAWTPADFNQRESDMYARLFRNGGGTSTVNQGIGLLQGRCVGGSTVHNLNLIKRLDDRLFAHWKKEFGLEHLGLDELTALYDEAEKLMNVHPMTEPDVNANNAVFRKGCQELGYHWAFLRHNRRGCQHSGFCELGCAYDAKENAMKVWLPQAMERGARVLADLHADRLQFTGTRAVSLHASLRHPLSRDIEQRVVVRARQFIVSASATGTPALLQRSQAPDPYRRIGRHLRIHPAVSAVGLFPERLNSWMGVPQVFESVEYLGEEGSKGLRIWLIPTFAHPAGLAGMVPGPVAEHQRQMRQYAHMAAVSAMLHDESEGEIMASGDQETRIAYWPELADRRRLLDGLREAARILLAGGARKVMLPFRQPVELEKIHDLERRRTSDFEPLDLPILAVHPMGTARMSDDPKTGVCDSTGKVHGLDNVYVADTSLFCTSTGGPPQLTAYALGIRVGRAAAAA